ncbi:MAG: oligoendopeptidase F [Oscillospiraceae bacterium]|nr:oligoendopeptidase F [Oscillospiraceae bacterium]MBR0452161.1 oligoendopeptidase F [Oscillospiraceae bacterium]
MAEKRIPKRSEVPAEYTWKLEDLFETEEQWLERFEKLKDVPSRITEFQGRIGESAEVLFSYLKLQDEVSLLLEPLFTYAFCKKDEDTANNHYQDLVGKAMGTYVAIDSARSFAVPEIMAIDDAAIDKYFEEKPELKEYRRVIDDIRRRKAHVLSPEAERVLALSGELAAVPESVGSVLRSAEMKFPDVIDAEGIAHQMTEDNLPFLLENSDVNFRKQAFDLYYEKFSELKNTLAAILDGQFKGLVFNARARNYSSTLEASLDDNEVPTEVYHNLISAVHDNLDKMYHYVRLRKKMMGLEELHMYDVYAPIVKDVAVEVPFDKAKDTVLKALAVLGEDYTDLLKEGFENRWIDVYPNEGKTGGAYSTGSGRPHPYVLLNQKDNLDSMFTLAHEMGHALHSYHSTKNQPVCTSDYVIFVAEVASTCNEILLMKYLLKNTEDKKQRAYLINHFLDSFKGTVYRQTMFAEFELMLGQMAENGEALTADALNEKYYELNKLYFGPDMISDDWIAYEWARIPHFFYNYYVFQYATGFSAAVAIANRILEEGETAVKDYKRFLSSGSSMDPISLLKLAGVDMSTPDPINSALSLFGELVDELENLAE